MCHGLDVFFVLNLFNWEFPRDVVHERKPSILNIAPANGKAENNVIVVIFRSRQSKLYMPGTKN